MMVQEIGMNCYELHHEIVNLSSFQLFLAEKSTFALYVATIE